MSTNLALFSGFRRDAKVSFGNLAKASSLGAKTVKGPSPLSASMSPAAVSAAANVLKFPLLTAVSTMSFLLSSAEAVPIAIDTKNSALVKYLII